MLRITATAYKNRPLDRPFAAEFQGDGGSIGRSTECTLVLPDDKRHISRTQAAIRFSEGRYLLSHHGSTTQTVLNGTPLRSGSEVELGDGDELRIADYVLNVSIAPADPVRAAVSDPFDDLLPERPMNPPVAAQPAKRTTTSERPVDIFDTPFSPATSNSPTSSSVIPDDFDPFAATISLTEPAPAPPPSGEFILPSPSGTNLDEAFGLRDMTSKDPLAFFGSEATSDDAFTVGNRKPFSSTADHASLLDTAYSPPRPQAPPDEASRREPRVPQRGRAPATPPGDMILSWETPTGPDASQAIRTVVLPSAPNVASAPAKPEGIPPHASARGGQPSRPAEAPPIDARDTGADLLRAFLEGACIDEHHLRGGLTPETARVLGQVLHEAIRGTLDLLLARALTKREVRAEVTVIVARENNPLKFSPNAEAALRNLLSPQSAGFMTPLDAMRDAYNDLRSHQFGFMAGMRGALEGVLARFEPAQLEQRLTGKSVLASLVPSTRRAKLWQLYEQLYREIMKEAEDDFQALFGREFLRAYEAQIAKLEAEDAGNNQ